MQSRMTVVRYAWSAAIALFACTLWIVAPAYSQQITGSVVVTVTDNTGAVLSGADLRLTMTSTGLSLEGKTHPDGTFTYPSLQPGAYELRVTSTGFKAADITGITVSIGEHLNIPVKLEVGTVKQSVTVSAATESMLNAGSPSVGQVIHTEAIRQLPLNGRNFMQLLLLGTGVTPVGQGDSPASSWTGRDTATVIMGGLRESDVSYLVNGIDTRNARFGSAGIFVSPDAIQEFRNQRTTFGAEFGHSAAVVNMTLRSGSNNFHGDIFELNRNRDYAANDYFLNNEGLSRPPFNQNNFGATLAGPVWLPHIYDGRNKTFFMFNLKVSARFRARS